MTLMGDEPITNDPMQVTIKVVHHGQTWEITLDAPPSNGGIVDDFPNSPQWIAAKAAAMIEKVAFLVQYEINPAEGQLVRVVAVGP